MTSRDIQQVMQQLMSSKVWRLTYLHPSHKPVWRASYRKLARNTHNSLHGIESQLNRFLITASSALPSAAIDKHSYLIAWRVSLRHCLNVYFDASLIYDYRFYHSLIWPFETRFSLKIFQTDCRHGHYWLNECCVTILCSRQVAFCKELRNESTLVWG